MTNFIKTVFRSFTKVFNDLAYAMEKSFEYSYGFSKKK